MDWEQGEFKFCFSKTSKWACSDDQHSLKLSKGNLLSLKKAKIN